MQTIYHYNYCKTSHSHLVYKSQCNYIYKLSDMKPFLTVVTTYYFTFLRKSTVTKHITNYFLVNITLWLSSFLIGKAEIFFVSKILGDEARIHHYCLTPVTNRLECLLFLAFKLQALICPCFFFH